MSSQKDKAIENMSEAEKRAHGGQEGAATHGGAAKEHAHEALQQGKEAASGKEMQMSSGMQKQAEAAKASGQETASGISGAFSSLAEKAKGLMHSGTTATTEGAQSALHAAEQARTQAEHTAHESYSRIRDEAEKAKHSLGEVSAAAKAEKEAAQTGVAQMMDTAKAHVKQFVAGGETSAAKMHGQCEETAGHAKEATGGAGTGTGTGGSSKSH